MIPGKTHASFDDPNLVSRAGLVPVTALAEQAWRPILSAGMSASAAPCGVNAEVKVSCLVAGMAAGADSIDDMDVLRHGAMPTVRRRPGAVHAGLVLALVYLGGRPATGGGEPGVAVRACQRAAAAARRGGTGVHRYGLDAERVYGHAKEGAGFGHTKIQGKALLVRGLNVLAAVISTPFASR